MNPLEQLEKPPLLIDEAAMKLAIDEYRKIFGEQTCEPLIKNKINLSTQYFALKRYAEDHERETDREKVSKMLEAFIPLKDPVKKIHEFDPFPENFIQKKGVTVGPFQCGVVLAQGPRESMEDNYTLGEIAPSIYLFAIFDGHGGDQCNKFIKNNLKKQIERHLNTDDDLACYNSLVEICVLLNEAWKQYACRKTATHLDLSGSTLLFALIINDSLWIVNVGDSRAVLAKGSEAIQMSDDAKPFLPHYAEEIVRRGGFIKWGRVDGCLDLARSIGDMGHPSVSARPTIRKCSLENLSLLILATDGLWDVIGSKRAVQLCQNGGPLKKVASDLVTHAYIAGATDNVSVMVINFCE